MADEAAAVMTAPKKSPLAARVKRLRLAAGLTQQDLATRAELSVSVITQIEQAKIADPRFSTLRQIAKVLDVTVDELMRAG